MNGLECPYIIQPMPEPTPIWITVSDINSVETLFVFSDAAIRCHPFVLMGSFILGILTIFVLTYIIKAVNINGIGSN